MTKVKLTKTSLRREQMRIGQLKKYLPTLKLKKALLQIEINNTQAHIEKWIDELNKSKKKVRLFAFLFKERFGVDYTEYAKIKNVQKSYENIAGVDIPVFENVIFNESDYFLFNTPLWLDSALVDVKEMISIKERINVENEKKQALFKEWQDVSIRVNLFEKILIPRTEKNIKKINIFLSDQELAAVSQAKVAKEKILNKKES